eukprot:TRINITY_DN4485_c0_g1_i1.p1 TRINITY_DN4485_c0_g1~~TRINITY_DN4485_c0_g1_i1.p1  ORF type:complete len:324 (+),score=54.87 TRINITY_DN4485_c0_g1_i1:201-1172(+)
MAMPRPSRRRPDGPEDANPLNRRLPAEVVSRRRPVVSRGGPVHAPPEKEERLVTADLREVLDMGPDKRGKWLSKALLQAQDGRISATVIYDVIAHHRFASELTEKAGRRCYRVLHANLSLFSSKQQRFVEQDCELAQLFRSTAWSTPSGVEGVDAQSDEATAAETQAAMMEEMMARCRAFVREKLHERGEREHASPAPLASEDVEADGSQANGIPTSSVVDGAISASLEVEEASAKETREGDQGRRSPSRRSRRSVESSDLRKKSQRRKRASSSSSQRRRKKSRKRSCSRRSMSRSISTRRRLTKRRMSARPRKVRSSSSSSG